MLNLKKKKKSRITYGLSVPHKQTRKGGKKLGVQQYISYQQRGHDYTFFFFFRTAILRTCFSRKNCSNKSFTPNKNAAPRQRLMPLLTTEAGFLKSDFEFGWSTCRSFQRSGTLAIRRKIGFDSVTPRIVPFLQLHRRVEDATTFLGI